MKSCHLLQHGGSYHRVVPPGEYGEAVLVLTELLLDL